MLNLFQPTAGDAELAAIEDVFSSNWLGTGKRTEEFERAFAVYVGRPAEEMQLARALIAGRAAGKASF